MTTKNVSFSVLLVLLVGFFFYLNRDWFTTEKIQISDRSGPALRFPPRGNRGRSAASPILFEFNQEVALSSIKVVAVSDAETNKYPHALWDLVPVLKPVKAEGFEYGVLPPGMKTTVPRTIAEPLQPGVKYRLIIEAGSRKVEHDFTAQPLKR